MKLLNQKTKTTATSGLRPIIVPLNLSHSYAQGGRTMSLTKTEAKDICERLSKLESQNEELDITLKEVDSSTKEIIEFFNAFKGAFKTLEMMAKLARPLGVMLLFTGACISLWASIKGGGPFK